VERGRRYTLAVGDFWRRGIRVEMLRSAATRPADIDALARYLAALREPVTAPAGRRLHRRGE
jgi:hypothetical protein